MYQSESGEIHFGNSSGVFALENPNDCDSTLTFEERAGSAQLPSKSRNCITKAIQVQILRILLYSLGSILIFYACFQNRINNSYVFQTKQFEHEMLQQKQIRGVFPPMNPDNETLLGSWNPLYLSDRHSLLPQQLLELQKYKIQFKLQDVLYLGKQGCKDMLRIKWRTYYSNIFLTQILPNKNGMEIEANADDMQCLKTGSSFAEKLLESSVWTVYQDQLFILVEGDNLKSLLVFQKDINKK